MREMDSFDRVVEHLCRRKLQAGITELENYLLTYPQLTGLDKLSAIKVDYELMAEYWKRGAKDPEREQVYNQLLHRLYMLTMDLKTTQLYRSNSFWSYVYQRPRKNSMEWGLTDARNKLEEFVSDLAMLDLDPEHVRKVKKDELYAKHQEFMSAFYDYILTSSMWSESVAGQYVDILTSPTIDSNDQQLLVSAITLSALKVFDVNKMLSLLNVYRKSTDMRVKQRALVGWALTIDNDKKALYPEMQQALIEVCADETACQELTELQMQLFFCKNTENDQRKIHDEIMPDIMNNGRIKMTQKGLVEMDEDTLEDILHPEAAELDMEKMEQSVTRMANMQKQGSDIYFSGFSQMKRFPFFNELSNWLMPFYANHPAISAIWNNEKGRKFLHTMMKMGAFCDGDKYSFVLAFDQVLSRLPEQMVRMVENGEAAPMPLGGMVDDSEQKTPAYVRRMYLQDLYRFFRLNPMRNEFCNPFDNSKNYLFFQHSLFAATALQERFLEVVSFLIKRQQITDAERLLDNYPKEEDYQYSMLRAHILQFKKKRDYLMERTWFEIALAMKPNDKKAMVGLARSLYGLSYYDKALAVYNQLLIDSPESKSYLLNAAICMVNLRQSEEALKVLFKLNYLYPQDMVVVHVLAWALTLAGRYEEALKHFTQLLTQEQPFSDIFLNYGYYQWFTGNITEAIKAFRRYLEMEENDVAKLEKAFLESEHDILAQHQISDGEIQMMLDAVTA